ncbi:cellulose binding domain-containing protein [Streptodolium elevatio]|uniref:Cellulose binding domain-containing protein n=1 Tax=Streptodolium elevatio TaxID=3157996 RepID=A0ABV3DQ24_9ACTN
MVLRRANAPGRRPAPTSRALAALRGRVRWAVTAVVLAALPAVFVVAFGDDGKHTKLTAEYVRTGTWETGFSAQYVVRNTGDGTTHGWTLRFRLAPGSEVSTLWNGRMDHDGARYTVRARDWNHDLRPGETAVIGFEVRHVDPAAPAQQQPVECSINGRSCVVGDTRGVAAEGNTDEMRAAPRDEAPAGPRTPAPRAATPTTAPPTRTATAPGASPSGGATGTGAAPTAAGPPQGAAAGTQPRTPVRPYIDLAAPAPLDLDKAISSTGVGDWTLASVVDAGGCEPSWGGGARLDDPAILQRFGELRTLDAVAAVSFGGSASSDLAATCESPEALAVAYRKVVDLYDVERIDIDVEGRSLGRPDIVERRNEALKLLRGQLEAAGGRLELTYTLPALPTTGLGAEAVALLADAAARGLHVDTVNVLAMDYGQANVKEPTGQMGRYAIDTARLVHGQLRGVWPTLTSDQAWRLISVTVTIGVDDAPGEVFTLDDAHLLADFAAQQHLGRLSWWAAGRDRACPDNAATAADPLCSGVPQAPYAFLGAFLGRVGLN